MTFGRVREREGGVRGEGGEGDRDGEERERGVTGRGEKRGRGGVMQRSE